jgi:hypothetical protein
MADRLGLRWLRAHTHLPALGRWRVGVLLALGGVLLLFVVFVSVDGGLYYDQTHYGVSVAGRDLGGLSRDEAIAALTTFVQGTRKRLIILTGGDKSWKVLPGDVGTTVDVAASVSDLGRRIELYFSGRDLPLQGAVDDAKLDELVHQFATELDRQPVDARMVVDANQVTITEEQPGALVDKQALRDQLTALLFTMDGAELQIPMITVKPDIGVANLSPALEGARTMISSELALTYGHKTWTLTPEDIASFMDLTYRTVDGVTTAAPAFRSWKASRVRWIARRPTRPWTATARAYGSCPRWRATLWTARRPRRRSRRQP